MPESPPRGDATESIPVSGIPRHLQEVGERLEPRFGPLGREYRRIGFDRRHLARDPTLEWVTPGHPLFEAVREEVWEKAQTDLRRGAVFYDPHRTAPARLEVYSASVADGRGKTRRQQWATAAWGFEWIRLNHRTGEVPR